MSDPREHQLIDAVYEAALVPSLWPSVLAKFADICSAKDAVLCTVRGEEMRFINSSPAFEQLWLDFLSLYPGASNERTKRLMALQHPGFATDADVFTMQEMAQDPIYRDFFIPRGYGFGVATAIEVPSGDTIIVHAERDYASGPVGRDLVAQVDRTRSHFARAGILAARFDMERARTVAHALEMIGLPAAVLGWRGQALAANPLLVRLMPDVAQDRPSRLGLTNPSADRLLLQAFAALGKAPHDAAVRSIPIAAEGDNPPFIAHLVPVTGAGHDVLSQAHAILVVTPVVPGEVPTASVIQGLFDLTPAEAKLAALIAAGSRPRDAALALGIGEETVRTTLKRVFAKTGLERQADLVGLLQGASLGGRVLHTQP